MPKEAEQQEEFEAGFEQFAQEATDEGEGQQAQTQDAEGQGEPPTSAGPETGTETEERKPEPVEAHDYGREVQGLKSRLGRAEAELKQYRQQDAIARENAAKRSSVEGQAAYEEWVKLDPDTAALADKYVQGLVERRLQEALGEVAGSVDARVQQVEGVHAEHRQQMLVQKVAQALGDERADQWTAEYQTPEFADWLKRQPKFMRDLEHAEDPEPADIAYVFRQYRSQVGQTKQEQQVSDRKAAALKMSRAAPSRSSETRLEGVKEQDSFQAGFDKFVRERAQREKRQAFH